MRRIFGAVLLAMAAELAGIVWLSQRHGFPAVFLEMLLSAAVGVLMFQRNLRALVGQSDAPVVCSPSDVMSTAAVRAAGAVALVLPGVLGDLVGLVLWIPPITNWIARQLSSRTRASIEQMSASGRSDRWVWQWPPRPEQQTKNYDFDILPSNEPGGDEQKLKRLAKPPEQQIPPERKSQ